MIARPARPGWKRRRRAPLSAALLPLRSTRGRAGRRSTRRAARYRVHLRLSNQRALHDHAIPPLPIQSRMPLIGAHHPKTALFVETQTGDILGKDAGEEFPKPEAGVRIAERGQGKPPGPLATMGLIHVHGMLRDPRVAGARTIRSGGCESDQFAVRFHHDRREALALVPDLLFEIGRRTR